MKNIEELNVNMISTEDMAVTCGFSLFETMLVNTGGQIFLPGRHIDRLMASMKHFNFKPCFRREELLDSTTAYVEKNKLQNVILRITVTYGSNTQDPFLSFTTRKNPYTKEHYVKGIKLTASSFLRDERSPIIRHKTGSRLENQLEGQHALEKGFDDAVFVNTKGHITETTKSNIFFVKEGVLHTPHISCGLLPGIIRSWLFEAAAKASIETTEGDYTWQQLLSAEEAFVTNSVMGIMPISSIDGVHFEVSIPGRITALLMDALKP